MTNPAAHTGSRTASTRRVKVAVLDDYQHAALRFGDWSVLQDRIDLSVFHDHLDHPDDVVARLAAFDVVCMMRERTPLSAGILRRLPNLKLIVTTAMRNAALDLDYAKSRGIVVCGTDALHTGTPELTWMLLLALARHLPAEHASVRSGGWQTGVGMDLHGSTLGIVGLGRVGSRVARVAQAFGMRVIAWSPHLTDERARDGGAIRVDRHTLFREADFVVISMQLRAATRGLVGAEEIGAMKPGAYLINTSRGAIVDEQALIEALRERRIGGAGLDAFNTEPLPPDHPFRSLDNVIATPHVGYVTQATYRRFFVETIEDIAAWLDGAPIRLVDEQVWESQGVFTLRPREPGKQGRSQ